MQAVNEFVGNSILWGIVVVAMWIQIFKALHRSAPEVTNAAKTAATSKAISLIGRLFK